MSTRMTDAQIAKEVEEFLKEKEWKGLREKLVAQGGFLSPPEGEELVLRLIRSPVRSTNN